MFKLQQANFEDLKKYPRTVLNIKIKKRVIIYMRIMIRTFLNILKGSTYFRRYKWIQETLKVY